MALPPLTPVRSFPPELLLDAQRRSRAAIFDVDGVLTDGRVYISEHGEMFKAFHVLDGHGLKLLARGGIVPIVVTGRDSGAVRRRMADLGVVHAVYGVHDKLVAAERLLADLSLQWGEVATIGDDWPDLPLMQRAAFACAPADAHAEIKALARHVTAQPGGHRRRARTVRPVADRRGALCRAAQRVPDHAR